MKRGKPLGRVALSLLFVTSWMSAAAGSGHAVTSGSGTGQPAPIQGTAKIASANLCTAFVAIDSESATSSSHAILGWASSQLVAKCLPTSPPDGDACVAKSSFLQECLDCCVYNNQTILACAGKCFDGFPHIPVLPNPFPNKPANPQEQCCADWCKVGGGFGLSSCCNGAKLSCDCTPSIRPNDPTLAPLMNHIAQCTQQCEGLHQNNFTCQPGQRDPIFNDPTCGQVCSECTVNRCFVRCMGDFDCQDSANPAACQEIQTEFKNTKDQFCRDCTKCRETHK